MDQKDFQDTSLGNNGSVVTTDTTPVVGKFAALVVLNDAVFTAINATRIVNADDLVGLTLPAGTQILGQITGYTLTSGAVIAYNRAEPAA